MTKIKSEFLILLNFLEVLNKKENSELILEENIKDVQEYWEDFDEDIEKVIHTIHKLTIEGDNKENSLDSLVQLRILLVDVERYFSDTRQLIDEMNRKLLENLEQEEV
ncbi:hypothetical protein ACWOFR_12935 [Carnobacterium gallinarum]|uniref:hypothetical protein n=1 Tax=Carnobacterium gallinarum TaxID=2749 RepID=UPI00055490E0|nr:hypothetical protein [Carnobacterium gallinarum]